MAYNDPITDPGALPDPVLDSGQQDALDQLTTYLASIGLQGLVDWAWQQLLSGRSNQGILLDLEKQPAYQQRFTGNIERQRQGLAPLDPRTYLQLEADYRNTLRNAGLPSGFYDDPSDFASFIGKDVSARELSDRVDAARALIAPNVIDTRASFAEFYGVEPTDGALLAYALDPDRGLTVVQREVSAATLGAAATQAGLGLDRARAEQLGQLGQITAGQAVNAYSGIADELTAEQYQAGAQTGPLTQADLEQEAFLGDQQVARRRKQRAQEAASLFAGGGGAATERSGVTALGSPNR